MSKQYQKYKDRLLSVENLHSSDTELYKNLENQFLQLKEDLKFLHGCKLSAFVIPVLFQYSMLLGLQKAQITYEEKVSANVAEKMKFDLAWKIHELEDLQELLRKLTVEISTLMDKLESPHYDRVQDNFARRLNSVQEQMLDAVKRLSKHQRVAATHILVFMVSSESRSQKPYALPVQYLPICGIKDSTIRSMANKIIEVMVEKHMNVAGK